MPIGFYKYSFSLNYFTILSLPLPTNNETTYVVTQEAEMAK